MLIENLWNNYISQNNPAMRNEKEKELVALTVKLESRLLKTLDNQEKELLEKFTDSIYRTEDFLLQEAFFDGAKFCIHFLMELLLDKRE